MYGHDGNGTTHLHIDPYTHTVTVCPLRGSDSTTRNQILTHSCPNTSGWRGEIDRDRERR